MERKGGEGAKYCERIFPELFLERWNTRFTLEISFLIRVFNSFFFYCCLSRTSISQRLKSVCTFVKRFSWLSFFFFFFWNKREKGRSKDTSGTKGRRILFFLSEEVKDFRARIRQIWGRSWKIYKSSYLTFFVVPSSWPSFSDDGCRLKRRRNWCRPFIICAGIFL